LFSRKAIRCIAGSRKENANSAVLTSTLPGDRKKKIPAFLSAGAQNLWGIIG